MVRMVDSKRIGPMNKIPKENNWRAVNPFSTSDKLFYLIEILQCLVFRLITVSKKHHFQDNTLIFIRKKDLS